MMDDIEGSAEVNQCQKTDVTPINRLQEVVCDADQCSGSAVTAAESVLITTVEMISPHVTVNLITHNFFDDFTDDWYVGDGPKVVGSSQLPLLVQRNNHCCLPAIGDRLGDDASVDDLQQDSSDDGESEFHQPDVIVDDAICHRRLVWKTGDYASQLFQSDWDELERVRVGAGEPRSQCTPARLLKRLDDSLMCLLAHAGEVPV